MTDHTPGEWEQWADYNVRSVKDHRFICSCGYSTVPTGNTPEENRANVRLIVAAPKLLEACREAMVTYEGMDVLDSHSEYAYAKLRTAIAKVDGKGQ